MCFKNCFQEYRNTVLEEEVAFIKELVSVIRRIKVENYVRNKPTTGKGLLYTYLLISFII